MDFSDLSNLEMNYENRLQVLLGSYENVGYKLKFVKKVIQEEISDYEKALIDYRGDKLYVRTPETEEPEDEVSEKTEEVKETEAETAPETDGASTAEAETAPPADAVPTEDNGTE